MRQAVIVSAVRTPLGSFNGTLAAVGATKLGAIVIEAAVQRAGIDKAAVNEVIMGQVLPCGYGQNPAKQAAVLAQMPWEVEALTVNKVCGSALKAVMLAAQAVQTGDADVVVAGGMENMSAAPYYLEKARFGYRMGPGAIQDHMVHDGLWDIVNDFHMGISNDLCSQKYNVSREDQDRYAAESYRRALASVKAGTFADEIVPVSIPQRKGEPVVFKQDECPRETSYELLAKMSPGLPEKRRCHGRKRFGHQRRRRRGGGHDGGEGARARLHGAGLHRRPGLGRARHEVRSGRTDPGRTQMPQEGRHRNPGRGFV